MLDSVRERLADSRRAFAAVFTNRRLRRLEVSWAGTICAYWIFIVTLSLYAYEHGGAAAVGVVGLLRVLPSVVGAPFGALLGDRYPRERVMVGINVARSLTIGAAAAAAFTGAPTGIVYALGGLMGLLQSTFRPTQAALLPLLARTPEELTAANLVLTTIDGVGMFIGPAVAGLLLAVAGTDIAFAATACVFLVSAFLLAGIRTERSAAPSIRGGLAGELFAGYRTVIRSAPLRLVVGLYGAQTLVAGALNVLIVVSALELLDLGKPGIGFLNAAVGVGAVLGGLGALALVGRRRLGSAFGIGIALLGLPIALVGVVPETAAALALLAVVGLGTTVVDVAAVTLLQRTVPNEVMTRVMGVVQSVFVGTLGLGAALVPLVIAAAGIRAALIATGSVLPALALLAWRPLSALDDRVSPPSRELELLRAIPLFSPLPAATLEQLVGAATRLRVAAGTEVVRQGTQADRFYVIAAGEVEVSVDGRAVEPLRAGDHFGEIGLLRDVARTATVRARTDVDLLALDRDDFVTAVTGSAESAAAAHAIVAARLSSLRPTLASV